MKLTHVIMEADKRQNLQDGQRAGDPGKETAWLQEEGPEAPDPRLSPSPLSELLLKLEHS